MKHRKPFATVVATALAAGLFPAASASAAVVSIDFVGNGTPLLPTDVAGNPNVAESFTANWNSAPGGSGTALPLVDAANQATGITLTYSTDLGGWALPNTGAGTNTSGGANPEMMRGYLDAQENGQVTLSGLSSYFSSYQVAIFFDGDNGGEWRVARYRITADGNQLFEASGEDSEGEDFNSGAGNNANGVFQVPTAGGSGDVDWPNNPNNGEGNFILSDLLTADTITINTAGTSNTLRAPINGLQIIGTPAVPEPTALALLGLAAFPALARRRRTR